MYKNRRTIDYFGGYSGQGMCGGVNRSPGSGMGLWTRRGIRELKLAHRTTIMMTGDRRNGRLVCEEGRFYAQNSRKAAAAGVAGAAAGM